jgi:hypothetical protein
MSKPHTLSRKRKRGKNKNVWIEDDDDAIDIVTVKEVTVNTPVGPVKKLLEVPLRSIASSEAGSSSQPQPVAASQTQDFDIAVSHTIDNVPVHESGNKVGYTYIRPVQRRCFNQRFPATILDAGIC